MTVIDAIGIITTLLQTRQIPLFVLFLNNNRSTNIKKEVVLHVFFVRPESSRI
jgi:hypothetical protein